MKKTIVFAGMLVVTGLSQLTAQETEIQEVTIASKTPQQLYQTGKPVKLLSAKDLERFKGQDLNEILQQIVGFQITGNFNNSSEPKSMKIRGGKSANVLILLDGIPLKDVTGNDYNVTDLRLLSVENVESIEVLSGASSVLYGSNATVSIINIKTKKSSQKPINAKIGTKTGSFGTFAQNILVNGKIKKFNYQFSGFNEKSDGISSALGENFDKDGFEKQNINARIGFDLGKFNFNINSTYNHHLFSFDNGAFSDGNNRGNDTQNFIGGNANYKYNKGNLTFNSRYSANKRELQIPNLGSYETQLNYKGRNFFNELYNQYHFSENINLVTGIEYETQKLGSDSLPWNTTEIKLNDTKISNFDIFTNLNLKYQNFHLDTGSRFNSQSKYGNHLVYSINPYFIQENKNFYFKVGYSFATAFISPTLYQFYGFSSAGTLPNLDLNPETNSSHEIDLSFGKKDQSLIFNASFFQRKEKDVLTYIEFVNWTNQFINIDKNTTKGFELGLNYKPNRCVNFGGNFSFVENTNQESMVRQPKQRINSFVEISLFTFTRINFSHQFVSTRTDKYGFPNKYVEDASYHLLILNINQKLNKNIEMYLNIGNLFYKSYVDIIGYTTKPRNYTFGINYQF